MLKKITLSLLLMTQSLFCHPDIEKEYPELRPFFQSPEFKGSLKKFSIEIINHKALVGQTRIEIGSNGIKRIVVFSDTMINRNNLSAEELKFILCHELGHVNDPRLWTHGVIPSVLWISAAGVTAGHGAYGLFNRCPEILLKTCKAVPFLFVGLAAVQYLARQGEYFADEYGLKMTKNLEAAIATLEKRRTMTPDQENAINPLKALLRALFADHPSEEDRIERLKNIKN